MKSSSEMPQLNADDDNGDAGNTEGQHPGIFQSAMVMRRIVGSQIDEVKASPVRRVQCIP